MAIIHLKKGYDIRLKGGVDDSTITNGAACSLYAIVPDDFHGIVPRMDKKEGEHVLAGEPLYHDKNSDRVMVTSPVSGTVKAVQRGERRKIEAVVIEADKQQQACPHDIKQPVEDLLLGSGLWAMMRQRPYDVVPTPGVRPRDIFVTAFDSAPLAPSLKTVLGDNEHYINKGIEEANRIKSHNNCSNSSCFSPLLIYF